MTYQGARAQPIDGEKKRFFSVSRIRLNPAGWPTHVLWSEVNAKSNGDVGAPVVVTVADVINALHDGAHVAALLLPPHPHAPEHAFEVIKLWNGNETINLVRSALAGAADVTALKDLATLDLKSPPKSQPAKTLRKQVSNTFAVSQVMLDDGGRITDVLWGRVDTVKNAWAEPETLAPVAAVVAALQAGDQVYALFPSTHGHLPDRQFAQADYDGGRQTIVLVGPTVYEREIHDMDRIPPAIPHRAKHTSLATART